MYYKVLESSVFAVVGTALPTIGEQMSDFCSATGAVEWRPVPFRKYVAVRWDGNAPELPVWEDSLEDYIYMRPEPSFMEIWD